MIQKNTFNSSEFQVIKSFQSDPFVGHLSTPITSSNLITTYLSSLPIYKQNLSPFLSGSGLGLMHGYFLLGPFFFLGPLRNTELNLFFSFLSVAGLILILTLGLLIYGIVLFQNRKYKLKFRLFTFNSWTQFSSGFFFGGNCGIIIANFILFYVD